MSIWPSIVAVVGTLAGALTAGLLRHRSARTARAEERADSHRQDQLGAVTDFAAAPQDRQTPRDPQGHRQAWKILVDKEQA